MCGIAGVIDLDRGPIRDLSARLAVMTDLMRHRGPDGEGAWEHTDGHVGLAHTRLSIIDLDHGQQPMGEAEPGPEGDAGRCWIVFNGEIYNYRELRRELGRDRFATSSDTEVILAAYRRWGPACVDRLRGMFAFAIWDPREETLFCARDRFGIKPFYYATAGRRFYLASEVKVLLPFLDRVATDTAGFQDYLVFQLCLGGKTLFDGVRELPPGHTLTVAGDRVTVSRYWEVYYDLDFHHTERYFEEQLAGRIEESIELHLRSDVPVGAYLSGGLDSSTVAAVAADRYSGELVGFTGRFPCGADYDESPYARLVADARGFPLVEIDIDARDFIDSIRRVVYHLDYPVAGPGSFPQYVVSREASRHRKVVLGGQGGDEIFGGYTRYLIAYFEQCIKAAIDGTIHNGSFIVTYESIIPNLRSLRNYKPLLKQFWSSGLFEPMDRRYFQLINRSPTLGDEINREALGGYSPLESFREIFNGDNVGKESYFDLMTHFDFKTLLPALLHVEDRVSMAHGLESRVPLLDHPLVELAATIPSDIKFKNGTMKRILKETARRWVPGEIVDRTDKMGFPVPLTEWLRGELRDFVLDVFSSRRALERDLVDNRKVAGALDGETRFGRRIWGLLCLELWQQEFHDRAGAYRAMLREKEKEVTV